MKMRLLFTKIKLFALSVCFIISIFSTSVLAQVSQEFLETWLLNASESGDILSVQATIAEGASVTVADEEGCTPLMYAFGYYECFSDTSDPSDNYHVTIIRELLSAGAKLNSQQQLDVFLLRSVEFHSIENVQRALEMGANIDGNSIGPDYPSYRSPLIQASESCNEAIARDLIIRGADINRTDSLINHNVYAEQYTDNVIANDTRETALDVAIKNCREDSNILRLLRDVGSRSAKSFPRGSIY